MTGDVTLEDVIATALTTIIPGEAPRDTTRRVLTTLAERAPEPFVVTKPGLAWLEAATPTGSFAVTAPSCVHLYAYGDGTTAGTADEDPDVEVAYLHLCDLDDHVATLLSLRELLRRHQAGEVTPVCEHRCLSRTRVGDTWVSVRCQACGWRPVEGEVADG